MFKRLWITDIQFADTQCYHSPNIDYSYIIHPFPAFVNTFVAFFNFFCYNEIMNEFENVVVTDKRKIEEIKQALQSTESSFEHIKPAEPDKLPENAKKIWFGIDKP